MRRNTVVIGFLAVLVGLGGSSASALTLDGAVAEVASADSLLSALSPNPALEAYVREGTASPTGNEGLKIGLPQENTSPDLLYYVSGVASPMANFVLDKSNRGAAAPPAAEQPVPEPASGLLLLGGLGLLGAFKRRKCS